MLEPGAGAAISLTTQSRGPGCPVKGRGCLPQGPHRSFAKKTEAARTAAASSPLAACDRGIHRIALPPRSLSPSLPPPHHPPTAARLRDPCWPRSTGSIESVDSDPHGPITQPTTARVRQFIEPTQPSIDRPTNGSVRNPTTALVGYVRKWAWTIFILWTDARHTHVNAIEQTTGSQARPAGQWGS